MSLRLAACLLLSVVSVPLMAKDVRHLDANGAGGGCAEATAHAEDAPVDAHALADRHPARRKPAPASRPPSAMSRGGGELNDPRPPRWHSLLPGMFR